MLIAYISACVCHFPPIFFISLPVSGLDWKRSDVLLGVCEIILEGLVDIGGPTEQGPHGKGGGEGRDMWIVCSREGCHQKAGSKPLRWVWG